MLHLQLARKTDVRAGESDWAGFLLKKRDCSNGKLMIPILGETTFQANAN